MSRVEFDDSHEFKNIYSILENVYNEIFQFILISKVAINFCFFYCQQMFYIIIIQTHSVSKETLFSFFCQIHIFIIFISIHSI